MVRKLLKMTRSGRPLEDPWRAVRASSHARVVLLDSRHRRAAIHSHKAAAEMTRYRRKGPDATTRLLRDGLMNAGLVEGTLLDVGGGVGAQSFELLDRGVARAVVADASVFYLAVASE